MMIGIVGWNICTMIHLIDVLTAYRAWFISIIVCCVSAMLMDG